MREVLRQRETFAYRYAMPTYYHVTPSRNADSIRQHGLDRQRGESPWGAGEGPIGYGNFFWGDEATAQKYADQMTQWPPPQHADSGPWSVLPFDHDGPVERDPEVPESNPHRSYYSREPIPPSAFAQRER